MICLAREKSFPSKRLATNERTATKEINQVIVSKSAGPPSLDCWCWPSADDNEQDQKAPYTSFLVWVNDVVSRIASGIRCWQRQSLNWNDNFVVPNYLYITITTSTTTTKTIFPSYIYLLVVEDDIGQPDPFARHPHDLQSAKLVGIPRQQLVLPFL